MERQPSTNVLLLPSVSDMHNLPLVHVHLFLKNGWSITCCSGHLPLNTFWQLGPSPPSVHLVIIDITHVIFDLRPSPSIFVYCKWSNTGGGNGLGTRLPPAHIEKSSHYQKEKYHLVQLFTIRKLVELLHTCRCTIVWFPDPSSGGEREGSGELPAAWHAHQLILCTCITQRWLTNRIVQKSGRRGPEMLTNVGMAWRRLQAREL